MKKHLIIVAIITAMTIWSAFEIGYLCGEHFVKHVQEMQP